MHLSNQGTQRNQVSRGETGESVYTYLRNLVTGTLHIHAAGESSDVSSILGLFWTHGSQIVTEEMLLSDLCQEALCVC